MTKIYLDDERKPYQNWTLCRWPEEVIAAIKAGGVEAISLDHDLGEGSETHKPRTGMDVLTWLEWWVMVEGNKSPRIYVHSMNAAMVPAMKALARRIMMYSDQNGETARKQVTEDSSGTAKVKR